MRNAIPGLSLDPKYTAGYRVVGADRNACPRHFGVFATEADAAAYRDEENAKAEAAGSAERFRVEFWVKRTSRARAR